MRASFLLIFLAVAISIISIVGNTGCANIIPPAGGPRDSLPPVLVEASHPDSTVNFRGDRLTLTFDEFIDIRDPQNNFLFTPIFENNPRVAVRLRTVTVRFPDTLEANTTYVLNFGNAIVDINESNVLRNFTYTFSTGPSLDSLGFSGKVVMAETGGIDTTLQVLLHRNLDDSAVVNDRPRYVARVDRNGNFRFSNLPAGRFNIYALGDAGIMRRYTSSSQYFAFADSPITVGQDTAVTLFAYRETATATPTATATTPRTTAENRLRFVTNQTANQQDLLTDLLLSFTTPLRTFDSTRVVLTTDSAFRPTPFTLSLDSARKVLRVRTAWQPGTTYNLILDRDFATDTLNRRLLKTDTLTFNTRRAAEYGSLNLSIRNLDASANPVLLFIQNDAVVFSTPIASGNFTSKLFLPGDYELRVLYDRNRNGKWDAGQFFGEKRQPELVRPITQRITIKPAWDNELERSL
jgi:hypothetical protein